MPDVQRMEPASIGSSKMPTHTLVVLLGIGAIYILGFLFYNTLFPEAKAYWQSCELERNRAKWESQHITHYRMSLNIQDRMPLTVEVQDGKVVSAVNSRGETMSPEDDGVGKDFTTIPGLFSYVYQTVWEKPQEIRVSYDPAFGYPDSIYIDYRFTEPCCGEDMIIGIEVRNLQVLPP